MQYLDYPTKDTINKLSKELNLPRQGKFMQDWEYEVADYKRLDDFIAFYKDNILNSNEKITLMKIILESYNDYVTILNENLGFTDKISQILLNESHLYLHIIEYWSCENEDLVDCFAISPMMRKIKDKI